MPYKKILADNLILFRKKEHISQFELAMRLGVCRETISLIERESANVTLDILEGLCAYTGLTMSELFTEGFVEIENEKKQEGETKIKIKI